VEIVEVDVALGVTAAFVAAVAVGDYSYYMTMFFIFDYNMLCNIFHHILANLYEIRMSSMILDSLLLYHNT
jgi:hypothetical protein